MAAVTVIARVVRGIRDVLRGSSLPHAHLRDRLSAALGLTLTVDLIASTLLYVFERDAKGTDIQNFWDAFYFVSAQLTTLSSSMANPVTLRGEILCLGLDLYAITVVAALAGMFGGFFAHRTLDLSNGQSGESSTAPQPGNNG